LPPRAGSELVLALQSFKKQALHATRLGLEHPVTREKLKWEVSLPDEMQHLISLLSQDRGMHHD
jgi:23S rRNA pseudouridine1911/1915/1917 synthase